VKEEKALRLGIIIIVGCTVATPALAGIFMSASVDDMGVLPFTLTFAFLGACIGILAAKLPKKYIQD
jgi:hypothetical protein